MVDQVFAQTAPAAAPVQGMPMGSMIVFGAIGLLFYFLVFRPQGQERKKREDMLNNIQRGDRILTRGGLYGTVADIREQVLVLKINENTKIEVERSYVDSVQKQN